VRVRGRKDDDVIRPVVELPPGTEYEQSALDAGLRALLARGYAGQAIPSAVAVRRACRG
jgi:hypothetical protein